MKASFIGLLIVLIFAAVGCNNNATSKALVHRTAVGALGPYSGSVTSDNLVFLSGKIGKRGGSFAVEVNSALDAVEKELVSLHEHRPASVRLPRRLGRDMAC